MKIFYLLFLVIPLIWSCSSPEQKLVKETINAHGGQAFKDFHVAFDFRGMHYDFTQNKGLFSYQRVQKDTLGNVIVDILNNDSFSRSVNNEIQDLPDSTASKYISSVNSVAYFFLLPSSLEDPSVNKELQGTVRIKGKEYQQLRVWFDETGGEDHNDIFMFWINNETKIMDYLAYSYERNEGGVRFREATKRHKIGNFLFQDFNNYGLEDPKFPLEDLPLAFEEGTLPLLSEIKNENISLIK